MILWVWMQAGATPPPPMAAQMHERFEALTSMRDNVIGGRLEPAREDAQRLAAVEDPQGLPDEWRAWFAQVEARAGVISNARDLSTAAVGVAQVAAACGECHGATQGGPGLEGARDIPPQKWSEGDNMPLHRWAVDWLWLGLIADDDSAWSRGAAELDRKPLAPKFGDEAPEELVALEQHVYALAKSAVSASDRSERATLLGELFTTCARCHDKRGTP